jgi:hypothetical protein
VYDFDLDHWTIDGVPVWDAHGATEKRSGSHGRGAHGLLEGAILLTIWSTLVPHAVHIRVHEARGLPAFDVSGTSDPYIKLRILPSSGKVKKKTKVKKKDLNPVWNELFDFPLDGHGHQELQLTMWDWDQMKRNDIMGAVMIPLSNLPTVRHGDAEPAAVWYSLHGARAGPDGKIDLIDEKNELEPVFERQSSLQSLSNVMHHRSNKVAKANEPLSHDVLRSSSADLRLVHHLELKKGCRVRRGEERTEAEKNLTRIADDCLLSIITDSTVLHIWCENGRERESWADSFLACLS